ncbi:MAG TPA: prolyl oligopeptidase family serine peptidase, partial [Thermoanaerobaculia bacterium]|nr:prolyl oligopeptidase family serine peptidase [Thermoanaerobaculia bacterium]
VYPQVPHRACWLDEHADAAMRALDQAIAELGGDRTRVYLTGLSMGGYGAYHLALAHPDRFAAMIVVCGGIVPPVTATACRQSPLTMSAADPYAFTARALRAIPIRLFHGADDPIIPASESRRMADALRREGADVEYVEYAGVGHDSWDRAYAEPELWPWLLRQHRK